MNESAPINVDPHYLQGQIHGLRSLIRAVAQGTMTPHDFRRLGLQGLEHTRIALLSTPVPQQTLDGIDAVETWLSNATEGR